MAPTAGKIYDDLHASGYKSWREIGQLYGKSQHTVRVQAYKWRKLYQVPDSAPMPAPAPLLDPPPYYPLGFDRTENPLYGIPVSVFNPIQIPIPVPEPGIKSEILCVPFEDALVLGDLHAPYHNDTMLRRAIYVTQIHYPEVKSIIIGGDIFDFAAISSHPHTSAELNVSATLAHGAEVLRSILRYFDHCYICNGNHDERLSKKLDNVWGMDLLLNAAFGKDWPACDVQVTNLDYMHVGKNWLVGHPSNYSGQGGKTPSELAEIHQKNVICFHNHHVGMTQSKSGRFMGIDSGHMTQPALHYYRQRRLSKFTAWSAGFTILRRGFPYLFTEQFTDWASLGA